MVSQPSCYKLHQKYHDSRPGVLKDNWDFTKPILYRCLCGLINTTRKALRTTYNMDYWDFS